MSEVLSVRNGVCGVITLNRPKVLNALTLTMVRAIALILKEWAEDDAVAHVLIEGAGERSFCAGADIRTLHDWGKANPAKFDSFFREEYTLNRLIKRFPKPYIALLDGVTMGGGAGLSLHGRFRLATDRLVFAMPESSIGLFPDVGGTYFLPRLLGKLGTYLALTGARLNARDTLYAGLCTHYVPLDAIAALKSDLAQNDDTHSAIKAHTMPLEGVAPHAALQHMIDDTFAGESVSEILSALDALTYAGEGGGGAWAKETAATLRTKSPTSCAVALRQMRVGLEVDFEESMRTEMRIATRIMRGQDFYEGVRAVLIDKDNAPQWNPREFDAVSPEMVDAIFAPFAPQEAVEELKV